MMSCNISTKKNKLFYTLSLTTKAKQAKTKKSHSCKFKFLSAFAQNKYSFYPCCAYGTIGNMEKEVSFFKKSMCGALYPSSAEGRSVKANFSNFFAKTFSDSHRQKSSYFWKKKGRFYLEATNNENVNDALSDNKIKEVTNSSNDQNPIQTSRTIVITSGKGGVGKTTATANLGMSIARLGYKVALIDADIGLRNLDLLLGLENRILYTAMDILDGQCRLDQALIRDKRWKNLSLLSISKNRQRYNVTRKNMDNLVKSIASLGYQFILIDCPAGIDVGFINAISPAQEALIVITPEITAIRDADRVAGLLEANGIYNVKLLVNRVRLDMIQRNDMMSVRDVQEMLGIPLLGAIPEDNHVIISTNRGEPLVLKKKLTLSGIAFENAARRLIVKQDYFIDLTTPYKGVFQKVQELFFG